jgi:outer membrane receptor protein involved in Fe transport
MEAEGLTIVASRETSQQMELITREEIAAAHAPDLGTLLQDTLNLGLIRYGPYGSQSDLSLRGFDSERIAFLINGVPANSPATADFDLSRIDLNMVDRIEVIYGGSDSKYNVTGALGGVINIITLREQEPGLRISGTVSNTSALPGKHYKPGAGNQDPQWQDLLDSQNIALSLGLGTEKNSWSAGFSANRAGNHFLFTDYYGRTLRREGNEVWDAGGSLSLVRALSPDLRLVAGGDLYYGDRNVPDSGIAVAGKKQTDFSTRQDVMLEAPRIFRDGLALEFSLSHAWQILNHGPSRHDLHTVTAINRWHWYPLTALSLDLAGDYRYSYLDSTDMGAHDRQDGGLSLTAEYRPLEQFLIIPSLKAVFSGSPDAPLTLVPKLGFLWTPADSFSLKNNYFRGFKLPDFEDLYWQGGGMSGNPDLKPEDALGADLSAAWTVNRQFSVDGAFFIQQTTDSIHWYNSGGGWKPTNVGKAIFFGLDLGPRFEFPLGPDGAGQGPFETISLSLSYQYLLSYLLSYGYDYSSNKRIPYMPLHAAGFTLTVPWKIPARPREAPPRAGSLRLSGQFQGPRFADTGNLSRLKPYVLLNLNLNQEISRNLSAFVVFRNLLNQSYESFNDYYLPGLMLTAGIRAAFGQDGVYRTAPQ